MEGVGLQLLDGADLLPAFAAAGVLPQAVTARISISKFVGVNTVRSRWALVDDLATMPHSATTPAAVAAPPPTASQQQVGHAVAAAQLPSPLVSLEQLEQTVRGVAAEVLGTAELDSSGQFPAGGAREGGVGLPIAGCTPSALRPVLLSLASTASRPAALLNRWL